MSQALERIRQVARQRKKERFTSKPANEYVSHSRRRRFDARAIRISCQISHPSKCRIPPQSPLFSHFHLKNHPLDSTKTHFLDTGFGAASFFGCYMRGFCSRIYGLLIAGVLPGPFLARARRKPRPRALPLPYGGASQSRLDQCLCYETLCAMPR